MDILRKTAEQTAGPEDGVREKQACFPAEDITQPAVQRLERSQSQKIRSRNPAGQIEGLKITSDLAITGDDNCLVRRRQENLQKQES